MELRVVPARGDPPADRQDGAGGSPPPRGSAPCESMSGPRGVPPEEPLRSRPRYRDSTGPTYAFTTVAPKRSFTCGSTSDERDAGRLRPRRVRVAACGAAHDKWVADGHRLHFASELRDRPLDERASSVSRRCRPIACARSPETGARGPCGTGGGMRVVPALRPSRISTMLRCPAVVCRRARPARQGVRRDRRAARCARFASSVADGRARTPPVHHAE